MSIPLISVGVNQTAVGTTILLANTSNAVFAVSVIDIYLSQLVPAATGVGILEGFLQSFNSGASSTINLCQVRYSNNLTVGTMPVSENLISISVNDFIMLQRGGNIQFDLTSLSNISSFTFVFNIYGIALP
jgi:hypothetical protein